MNNVFNLSGDTARVFEIDIAGSPHQAMLRSSTYKVKVAYSCLSTTIQSITKRGGKVMGVRMLSAPMPSVDNIPVAAGVPLQSEPSSPVVEDIAIDNAQSKSRRPPSKSKKR
jgi:CpcD/allophycocyanin linker domain